MNLMQNQPYGTLTIDFYYDRHREIYVTIEQLAQGFGYKSRNAIEQMMTRHSYLYDEKFSVTDRLPGTDGKIYQTRLFNKRGITEIGMLSRTNEGKAFRQWLYDYLEQLEQENLQFKLQRAIEKPLRVELTDAISKWEHKGKWSYKQITDLMLKHVTGKNAKQLKGDKAHHTALDLLTAEQLEQYQLTEHLVISLLLNQVTYDMIKTYLKGVQVCEK
ncbi:BRO-N domain-containing protein [Tuanshanicoccus yangjingiae]|uniref:BRO-N domain-containing protein n=1 Tax=Aerococcaceae bacterium zg-252 TaxID=2796928 RepID=UPI00406413B7